MKRLKEMIEFGIKKEIHVKSDADVSSAGYSLCSFDYAGETPASPTTELQKQAASYLQLTHLDQSIFGDWWNVRLKDLSDLLFQ